MPSPPPSLDCSTPEVSSMSSPGRQANATIEHSQSKRKRGLSHVDKSQDADSDDAGNSKICRLNISAPAHRLPFVTFANPPELPSHRAECLRRRSKMNREESPVAMSIFESNEPVAPWINTIHSKSREPGDDGDRSQRRIRLRSRVYTCNDTAMGERVLRPPRTRTSRQLGILCGSEELLKADFGQQEYRGESQTEPSLGDIRQAFGNPSSANKTDASPLKASSEPSFTSGDSESS